MDAFYKHDGGDMSGSDEDDVFTFTISDGTNEVTKTITITADTVDDTAPTLTAETISVGVGNTVVFDGGTGNEAKLLANDNDNNSEGTSEGTLAISKVNGVAFGSLADSTDTSNYNGYSQVVSTAGTLYIKSDGTAAFKHTASTTDNDSFTYTATDGNGNESSTTITVNVSDSTGLEWSSQYYGNN